MKKVLLSITALALSISLNAQQKSISLARADENILLNEHNFKNAQINLNAPKSIVCNDTLHYPLLKEQVLGGPNFYLFEAWASDNEQIAQSFYYTGSSMGPLTIPAVQVFGRSKPSNTGPVIVGAAVYNVDANMNPTGSPIQMGTIAISDTNFSMRTIVLNQPATVFANYAIVVAPIPSGPGDIFEFYITDAIPGQQSDENLSRFKSDYYPASSGAWVNMPTLTASFAGGPYDFEGIIAPIVQYIIMPNLSTTPNPSCDGVPVAFNNLSSPLFNLTHRMYNYQAFSTYFLSEPDSTFAWDLGVIPTNIQWGASIPPYTYSAGSYTITLHVMGGFVNSCYDNRSHVQNVNPQDDATFNYSSNTLCFSGPNPSPTVVTPGGTFTASPGGITINPMTGEIDLAMSTPGTYTITYQTGGACPDISTQTVTLTTNPSAVFSYSSASVCQNAANLTPSFGTGASAGTFSATPSGLTINPSTGVVNISASIPGTYTITNNIPASGSCPAASHSEALTINALPSVVVSPSSPSFCSGGSVSITASGANTYTWSPATGLSSTSGATVTANPASTTTYTVTGTDANNCSNTANVTVTVNSNPTVTFNLTTNNVCVNAASITLSGGSPAGGTYSGTGVSGGQFNPSVAGVGTHTITYSFTNSNGCTGSATQTITVNACTGIIEESIANSLIIAPNPAREQLLISFNNANSNNVRVNIIAADGKLVYSENAAAASQYVKYIDVSTFAKGLYFIQIISEEGMLNNKLIVQ